MNASVQTRSTPWNKGKLVGQKAPLKLRDIWAIRVRLQLGKKTRDLALFNLAIDSKLRGCDLVKLRVGDVSHGGAISSRAVVLQQKTGRPVQFEITQLTRESLGAWIAAAALRPGDYLFPTRSHASLHLSTRQYARIVRAWVDAIGLEGGSYGTHTMRRTKASLIYRRTRNLRAVQLLLGHTKLERLSATSASRWTTRWRLPSRLRFSSPPRPGRFAAVADRPEPVIDKTASN